MFFRLLTTSRKTAARIVMIILTRDVAYVLCTRKNLLNVGSHLHLDPNLRDLLKDSSTLRDRSFVHDSAHVFGASHNNYQRCIFGQLGNPR